MTLRVEHPGLLTTVQDLGRTGYQHLGLSSCGAMDAPALQLANALVGNDPGAGALEVTWRGPTLAFTEPAFLAVTGADLEATLDGVALAPGRPCAAAAGALLSFGAARAGCRAYIAIAGGVQVPLVLGSRSTDRRSGIGGVGGRALAKGDVVTTGCAAPAAIRVRDALLASRRAQASWRAAPLDWPSPSAATAVVRIVAGPEHDWLTTTSQRRLHEDSFRVGSRSDRMGYRLEGMPLELARRVDMISSPVTLGTMQLPPNGEPIVLMADRQTIGGYPRIAQVATADLPLLAQLPPGARVRFHAITLAEAQRLDGERRRDLAARLAGARLRLR